MVVVLSKIGGVRGWLGGGVWRFVGFGDFFVVVCRVEEVVHGEEGEGEVGGGVEGGGSVFEGFGVRLGV